MQANLVREIQANLVREIQANLVREIFLAWHAAFAKTLRISNEFAICGK